MYRTPWVSSTAHRELPTLLPRGVTLPGYRSETHQAPPALPVCQAGWTSAAFSRTARGVDFQIPHLSKHTSFYWRFVSGMWGPVGWVGVTLCVSIFLPPCRGSGASLPGTTPYLDVAEDTPGAGAGPFGDISWGFAGFGVDSHCGGFLGSPK